MDKLREAIVALTTMWLVWKAEGTASVYSAGTAAYTYSNGETTNMV